jgi:hypothetical protein
LAVDDLERRDVVSWSAIVEGCIIYQAILATNSTSLATTLRRALTGAFGALIAATVVWRVLLKQNTIALYRDQELCVFAMRRHSTLQVDEYRHLIKVSNLLNQVADGLGYVVDALVIGWWVVNAGGAGGGGAFADLDTASMLFIAGPAMVVLAAGLIIFFVRRQILYTRG